MDTRRKLILASSLLTLAAGTAQLFDGRDDWHRGIGAVLLVTSFLWLAAFVRA